MKNFNRKPMEPNTLKLQCDPKLWMATLLLCLLLFSVDSYARLCGETISNIAPPSNNPVNCAGENIASPDGGAITDVSTYLGTASVCPTMVTGLTLVDDDVCAPDPIQVCLQFDAPVDAGTTVVVNGVNGDGSAGGMEICVSIPTGNPTCAAATTNFVYDVACGGTGIPSVPITTQATVYPEEPTVEIVQPECDGAGGSATLIAVNGAVCEGPILGTAGVTSPCPGPGTPATLTYSFNFYPNNSPCYSKSSTTTLSFPCDPICDSCPSSITDITFSTNEVCSGNDLDVCLEFDTTVDVGTTVLVNGITGDGSAGGNQICITVPTLNETCDISTLTLSFDVACGGTGVPLDPNAPTINPPTIYPVPFTVEVVQPECDGGDGSATLLAANGDICEGPVLGTAGITGTCPGPGTPATLSYAFDVQVPNHPCNEGFAGNTIEIPCDPVCDSCPSAIGDITFSTNEVCSGTDLDICLEFDATVDVGTTVLVNGITGDGSAGGNQICITVPTLNETCDISTLIVSFDVACGGTGVPLDPDAPTIDPPTIYPAPFVPEVIYPTCDGEAGSATLLAVNGDICEGPFVGTAGEITACGVPGIEASLNYSFSPFFPDAPCPKPVFPSEALSINCQACGNCPTSLVDATFSTFEICSGGDIDVCLTFDTDISSTTLVDLNGVQVTGANGGDQICVTVPTLNETCQVREFPINLSMTCEGNPIDAGNVISTVPTVYPAAFEVEVVNPACDGVENGSAVLVAANGDVCAGPVTGNAGFTAACGQTSQSATLAYNFPPFFVGTPCSQDPRTAGVAINCNPVCPDCPNNITDISFSTDEACSGSDLDVCFTFDADVNAETTIGINDVSANGSAGGNQICLTLSNTSTTNETCSAMELALAYDVSCGSELIPYNGPTINLPTIYPEPFTVEIINPGCDGIENGSASLVAVNGDVCAGPITGNAGLTAACGEISQSGSLTYSFPGFFIGSPCLQDPIAEGISNTCNPVCNCDITDHTMSNMVCDDNGTPTDPNDDTFTFDISLSGTAVGNTWYVLGMPGTLYTYDTPVTLGPYNISDGFFSLTFTDSNDSNCNYDLPVNPPAPCSPADACDSDNGVFPYRGNE